MKKDWRGNHSLFHIQYSIELDIEDTDKWRHRRLFCALPLLIHALDTWFPHANPRNVCNFFIVNSFPVTILNSLGILQFILPIVFFFTIIIGVRIV